MSSLKVFIPSAGLGERLRPITDHIPKPLMPILGKPVMEHVLEKVSTVPVDTIGINLHYKKEVIKDWIDSSAYKKHIQLFPEEQILGTGGTLKNASSFLKNGPFLVHNSDVLSDIDLGELISKHLSSSNAVTLAVHDYPEFNCLLIDNNGFLLEIVKSALETSLRSMENMKGTAEIKMLAFTGIAVYAPAFLKFLPEGESSVTDAWMKALSAGFKIGTVDVSGCSWIDIGTPGYYARAVFDALRQSGETVYIHPTVTWCSDVEFDGYIIIENQNTSASFSLSEKISSKFKDNKNSLKNITLRNCILLPGSAFSLPLKDTTAISSHSLQETDHSHTHINHEHQTLCFENCIVGPDFQINLSQSDFLEHHEEQNSYLIGTGGSDKKYYRIQHVQDLAVLMECSEQDPDFQRHIEYTRFFKKYSVPVPELIEANYNKSTAVFEDLGDLTLYSWLKCPRDLETVDMMYKKIIDIMVIIHTTVTDHVSECLMLSDRIFDYDYLRWETGYFLERFVNVVKNMSVQNVSELEADFHKLAQTVDSFHKTVIHRDLQSQNIMITRGSVPRILDYQGARIGPPAYDLVSLLWDPYYRLEESVRTILLEYYCARMVHTASWFDENEFRLTLLPCRLQRHMQALGAYGFLSSVKKINSFLKHAPEGLCLLQEDIASSENIYPALHDLISSIV